MKARAKQRAVELFHAHGGVLRTSRAFSVGIHREALYDLRDAGVIQAISRGVYCLSDHKVLDQADLVAASIRVPKGVTCLVSALFLHGITTRIPDSVCMAIPRRMRCPTIEYPPMTFCRFSDECYGEGVESHDVEGQEARVYSPEKTVADCFKFRNKIGLSVATEALRLCSERKAFVPSKLLHYAALCRVEKIMAPYLVSGFPPTLVPVPEPSGYIERGEEVSGSSDYRVVEAAARYADARKRVIIIAGPNGAGKTTFAREFLPREAACPVFVNADYIAAGLSPFAPDVAAIKAGRLMLCEIRDHVRGSRSFALETTLAGRRYTRAITAWRAAGYGVKLVFLHLHSVDLAIRRVAVRVAQGGHSIPEATVRRRFAAGWHNFNDLYKPLVDAWALYDSSGAEPRLIEEGENE